MANLKGVKTCLETCNLKPNYSELARIYKMDRRTAKKRFNGIQNKKQREKKSYLDNYIDIIKEKCNIPGVTKKSVYEFIKMNIDEEIGTYSNFRKYISKNCDIIFNPKTEANVLFETDYGVQLQFDWKGPITLKNKSGDDISFYIFSTTLAASRFHTFIYSKFMTLECVEKCLIETFKILGGVPKECLTDNMSSIVNYSVSDFRPEFKTFSKDMGFVPKHCRVDAPVTKGKVESCNRFMNWLLPYNGEFETEEELIKIIINITKKVNSEVNQRTNMPPVTLFEKEKEYLQQLPNEIIIEQYLDTLIPVKVQNTMLFHYKGCKYSVPKKYINKTLKVKEVENKLYVYYNKELVKIHDISNNKINYSKEDYIEGLSTHLSYKTEDDINALAEHNLELLSKIQK